MKSFEAFWLGLIIAMLAISSLLMADDVYNFYFQKAPGPQTVIQGGAPPASVPPPPPNSNVVIQQGQSAAAQPAATPTPGEGQSAVKTESPKEQHEETPKWQVGFGKAYLDSTSFSGTRTFGYTFAGQYNLSRYFAFDASIIIDEFQNSVPHEFLNSLDFSAGLVFTPFRFQVFNHDLFEVGLIGGAASIPQEFLYGTGYDYQFGEVPPSWAESKNHKIYPYYGARLGINITQTFGIVASLRHLVTDQESQNYVKLNQMVATVAWKF